MLNIVPKVSPFAILDICVVDCREPYVADPIMASTLGIVKGRMAPLDLMKIETPKHGPLYSFLTVGWGLMSDIDIESERLRAIGEIRFTLWAFWRVASLRIYTGRISYLPVTQRKAPTTPRRIGVTLSDTTDIREGVTNGTLETNGLGRKYASAPEASNQDGMLEFDETISEDLEVVTDNNMSRAAKEAPVAEDTDDTDWFPALTDPVPSDWTVEEGKFVMVYSSLQSHLGTHLFFAPEARPDDGILWLLIIDANVTRFQLLNYFKQQEDGNHLSLPYVRMVPVRAFRLESYTDCFMTVDGELIRTPVLQARVLSAVGRVLTF